MDVYAEEGKPLVLVGGMNGAGKTTLLDAIRLGLYGREALGSRTSRNDYLAQIRERIHSNPNLALQPTFAWVSIEFETAFSGENVRYFVKRTWQQKGRSVEEGLVVQRDGEALTGHALEEWPELVRALIPMGVVEFFFFDGEKIQNLAGDERDQSELANSIEGMLGLDVVDQLSADLKTQRNRLLREEADSAAGSELETLQEELETSQRDQAVNESAQAEAREAILAIQAEAEALESKITKQGGGFAKKRGGWQKKQLALTEEAAVYEERLRQFAGDLMPFVFVGPLSEKLRERVAAERRNRSEIEGQQRAADVVAELADVLNGGDWIPDSVDVAKPALAKIGKAAHKLLLTKVQEGAPDVLPVVHDLSQAQADQVDSTLLRAHAQVDAIVATGRELGALRTKLAALQVKLQKVPAEEVLRPMLTELGEINGRLAGKAETAQALEDAHASLTNLQSEIQRKLSKVRERIALKTKVADTVAEIPKIRAALQLFRERLVEEKVRELEVEVREAFNYLCRKKQVVSRVQIDRSDFGIHLFDRSNKVLPKKRLSAGEKQIFAIAVLWALARTSGRKLPVVIDTPLGRLDSEHRDLLIDRYFPEASYQVLILSTDTEVHRGYFDRLRPQISKSYRLEFQPDEAATEVVEGYFWEGKAVAAN